MLKRFKQKILSLGLSVIMITSQLMGVVSPAQAAVAFDDVNIEKAVRAQLGVPTGNIDNLANLTYLNAEDLSTTGLSVSDLSTASNLSVLSLRKNYLDQDSLLNLPTSLKGLYMSDLLNSETNVFYLKKLTNLEKLDLERNKVINLDELTNLTSLSDLLLEGSTFTPWTSQLNQLRTLKLGNNSLSDISFLVKSPNLRELYLGTNNISNITVLRNLTALNKVDLGYNPIHLNDDSSKVIQDLISRGVQVSSKFAVITPINYFKTNLNTVPITGLGRPGSYVSVNTYSTTVGADGRFTYNYPLQPGLNEINISLNESSTVSFKRYVVYDDSIVLTAPQNSYRTNDNVRLTGTSKLVNSRLDISVNDRYAKSVTTDISGNFTTDLSLATYGRANANNIIKIKPNAVGSDVEAISRTVYLDRNGPTLGATVNSTITKENYVTLSGSATDDAGTVTVTVNGTGVSFIRGTNTFERRLSLTRQGVNTFKVIAKDDVGNQTEKIINVTYDNVAPKLTVTSPATYDLQTQTMTYLISGTAEEGSIVKVNGIAITNEKGKFSQEIELTNGTNELVITATDAAGNVTTDTTRKIYSFAPTITGPANLLRINSPTVAVTGKGSPGTILKINNVVYKVPADGNIYKVIRLEPGVFTNITVEFNNSKITRRVAYDNSVFYSLGGPLNNWATNQNSATVTGKTEVDGTVNIKVNNVDMGYASIDNNGNFSKDVTLNLGENNILLTFTDYVGNVATLQRKVIYDNTPPELTIFSPTDKVQLKEPRLVGKTEAGSVVKINNETFNISQDGYIDVPLKLNLGDHNLTITSTDRAGNITTLTKQVTIVNNLCISFLEPTTEFTNNSVVTIQGSALPQSTVRVNNVPVSLDSNNNFSMEVTLREGKNPIVLTALDANGKLSEVVKTITLDTLKPIVTNIVAEPYASSFSTKGYFKLTLVTDLNVNNSPIQSYDLQFRTSEKSEWQDLKTDLDKASITLQPPKYGLTYYFRARAKDRAGNLGEWTSKSYKVIVPYDENALVIKKVGFKNRTVNHKAAYYNGTLTSSLKAGENITYKFTGNQVALIGLKGKYGAKAKIYIDGKYLGNIDTYSGTSKARQVLFTRTWSTTGTHTIMVVNAGNKSRYRIDLDAIAVGRA